MLRLWYNRRVNPGKHPNHCIHARAIYGGSAFATILAGVALRLVPMGLPAPVIKWGGSMLWAGMVYLLLAAFVPQVGALKTAWISGIVAALVELSRLIHSQELDAFRMTLAGKLLLGRVFSGWHFLVYGAAIAAAAIVDVNCFRPSCRV